MEIDILKSMIQNLCTSAPLPNDGCTKRPEGILKTIGDYANFAVLAQLKID